MPPGLAAATSGAGARRKVKKNLLNYPRAGKSGWRRFVPSLRLILASAGALFIALVAFVGISYASIKLPTAADFALAQTSKVYYAAPANSSEQHGALMGSFAELNREIVPGDQIAQTMKDAVVASEDKTFYANTGIDPQGLVRAVYKMATGGAQQGGSTITQQYIERYYMGTTETLAGKYKEMLLAVKVTNTAGTTKDQILADYLNTIYFGRGAYGVQTAAQAYFGKNASELTVSEAAMLVGVVPAPSQYDPAVSRDKAESRWNYVLDSMVQIGKLSQAERAQQVFPETKKPKATNLYGGPQGYLLDMVKKEMVAAGYTEPEIETGGFTIVTTVDKSMQSDAVTAIKDMPEDQPKGLGVSLVSIEPATGGIKALYGGPDFIKQQRNAATQDIAQAGSTFKPFTLAAALQDGKKLTDGYTGYSPMTIDGTKFRNAGNASYGWVTLTQATAHSVNTAYLQLNEDIGPQRTVDAAVAAGIPSGTLDLQPYLSNVLGTASVHPIDMAHAYATFAAQGINRKPHIVAAISAGGGHAAYVPDTGGVRAFDEDVMASATYAMTQVVQQGTGMKARALDRPVAGKTGTTDDSKSAWFCGFTPQLATVVALYQSADDGSAVPITPFGGYSSVAGGGVALDTWVSFMSEAMDGMPVEDFPQPTTPAWTPRSNKTKEATPGQTSSAKPTQSATAEPTATKAPETKEPETKAPETKAPETKAPETREPVEPTGAATGPAQTHEPSQPDQGGSGTKDGSGTKSGSGAKDGSGTKSGSLASPSP